MVARHKLRNKIRQVLYRPQKKDSALSNIAEKLAEASEVLDEAISGKPKGKNKKDND